MTDDNIVKDFPVPSVQSKFYLNDWEKVGDWGRRVGGAYLASLDTKPDALDLADWMLEEARRREPRGLYPMTGALAAKGMSPIDLVDRFQEIAEWLLENPRRRRRFTSEQARRGGQRPSKQHQKRRTVAAYLALQEELEKTGEILSWTEQADRLGITPRYLRSLRAQHAAHLAEPSWDDLLAEADAPILETKRKRCVVLPRRHALLRVLDAHPELKPEPIDLDSFLDDFPELPPIRWAVAA